MKPIVVQTLRSRKISIMWWSVAVAFFMFVNIIFYPSFKNDAAELQKSFENIPDAALQLLGGSTDFFSPVGFLNSQIFFIMLPMLLGILAISLGSRLIAAEEQDKTIESLLARPVSRGQLLASKSIAGLGILSIVTLVCWIVICIMSKAVGLEVSLSAITQVTIICFLMVASFGAIAFTFSATGFAKGASIGVSTFVAFGGYIVDSLSSTISWLQYPSKLFPFNYYHSELILRGKYEWQNILYFIGILILCGVVSWIVFRRRDLAS